jgi:hypothetical protein
MRTVLVLAALYWMEPAEVRACGATEPLRPHELDPAYASDATPPAVHGVTVAVVRSDDHPPNNCGRYAFIHLEIAATDDAAPSKRLAYSVEVVAGSDAPDHLTIPTVAEGPIVDPSGSIPLWFSADDGAFDVELAVRAIDLNGNVSEAAVVRVADDVTGDVTNDDAGMCSTGSGGNAGSWGLVLGVALFASQPRRSRARLRQWLKLRSS